MILIISIVLTPSLEFRVVENPAKGFPQQSALGPLDPGPLDPSPLVARVGQQ